jgi:hypothetical protein
MASSDFWHQRAIEFREIPYLESLDAELRKAGGSHKAKQWRAIGQETSISYFRVAAARAGKELPDPKSSDLGIAWLEALKKSAVVSKAMLCPPDEIKLGLVGRIPRVAEISARFCQELELEALQLEAKQKKGRKLQCPPFPSSARPQTQVAVQLSRLKEESHLTAQELAELVELDDRSVRRHLSGQTSPYDRHLRAYERVFSKQLSRKIVISKMP